MTLMYEISESTNDLPDLIYNYIIIYVIGKKGVPKMGTHRHLFSAEDPMKPFNGLETHLSISSRYHQTVLPTANMA